MLLSDAGWATFRFQRPLPESTMKETMKDGIRFLVTIVSWLILVGLLLVRVETGIAMFVGALALAWLLVQALRREGF